MAKISQQQVGASTIGGADELRSVALKIFCCATAVKILVMWA
jgi:hypothetical protein